MMLILKQSLIQLINDYFLLNSKTNSPLRYPGGKSSLSGFLAEIARINGLQGGTYLELYAGGAGAALNMLYAGVFSHIHINDFDSRIHAMWHSILNETESFCKLIKTNPVTIDEWHKQKQIFDKGDTSDLISLGFSTFFLNRTNRSGIIFKAGPIGGLNQDGEYKIDVRFNKEKLLSRVKKIASYADRITLSNLDAIDIISNLPDIYDDLSKLFIYLDPPYYKKGSKLYLNNYIHSDHKRLSEEIVELDRELLWLMSYDNVAEIKSLYKSFRMATFSLNYSLQEKREGSELMIFSPSLKLSPSIVVNNKTTDLVLLDRI